MRPTVIAVITARMGSERLPGKVMLPLAGKAVVAHIVERLEHTQGITGIWLGTSARPENRALIEHARSLGVDAYAGSEDDVVERHVAIAERTRALHLVRASADCPLFDIDLASRMIAQHVAAGADFTYVPATLSAGILIEVISAEAMKRVHEVYQGEHITVPIKERPEAFRIEPLDAHEVLGPRLYRPEFRLTLDEPADYEVLKAIYEALYRPGEPVDLRAAIRFLDENPEIAKRNAHVRQKQGNLHAQELDARVLAMHASRARTEAGKRGRSQRARRSPAGGEAGGTLYFRADGGEQVGLGHLLRCHALAQAARRRGLETRFLLRPGDGTGVRKLAALGEALEPLDAPAADAADLEATLAAMRRDRDGVAGTTLVVDHNGLQAGWIRGAREAGAFVLCINDLPKIPYAAQVVVNGNLGAEQLAYETAPDTRLLLGPAYALFRDEFLEPGSRRESHPDVARRVLVSLGGGDPRNVTQSVLEDLDAVRSPLELTLLLGSAYAHRRSLEDAARRSRHQVRIEFDLARTAPLFARADLALCAGGGTAYELALLGVPAVVFVLSETQRAPALALDATGAAVCAGEPDEGRMIEIVEALLGDRQRREAMGARGRVLFDGLGRERVLDETAALAGHRRKEVG